MEDQESDIRLIETPVEAPSDEVHKPLGRWRFLKHKYISVSIFISISLAFAIGLSSGYLAWGREIFAATPTSSPVLSATHATIDVAAIGQQVNPPEGYALPIKLGKIGPQLLAAGAIDYKRFLQIYQDAGQPLTDQQQAILTKGSDQPLVIDRSNAYFLLNFFWAIGLTNKNKILTEGQMMKNGKDNVVNYASTAGWTIGAKLPVELYASTALISLTAEQQKRLEEVAHNVFRPCCNNPTDFPDCNHGMAMLGLLEVMAAQNATVDEMFKTAKYVNAYWYPQQTLELAIAFKAARSQDFAQVDGRELTSVKYSSGSGFKTVHQWLANNGLLQQGPGGGNNCGV
jgi:hypothetical protein